MTNDHTDPLPPDMAERLHYAKVTQLVGDMMAEDPAWHPALADNRLRWMLNGWDAQGWAEVTVVHERGDLVAGAAVHWSMLIAHA